jgi:hypothetical protein
MTVPPTVAAGYPQPLDIACASNGPWRHDCWVYPGLGGGKVYALLVLRVVKVSCADIAFCVIKHPRTATVMARTGKQDISLALGNAVGG